MIQRTYRYYYRPNGDIDFKYQFIKSQLSKMFYINNLPYIESTENVKISEYTVDVESKTLTKK